MAKTASFQAILSTINTKPVEGGGLGVKVTLTFVAKGKSRQTLLDLMGMQEQLIEFSAAPVQGDLDLK